MVFKKKNFGLATEENGMDEGNSIEVEGNEGVVEGTVEEDVSMQQVVENTVNQKVINIIQEIRENIGITYIGEESMIDHVLIALLCGGHVLIEGVPGIG